MEDLIEVEKKTIEIKGLSCDKFIIYNGPFPVIKPAKEMTAKEIAESMKPAKRNL